MDDRPPIGPVLVHYDWDERVTGYGQWAKTRCPFHGDRTPSAAVNEEEGLFSCHAGCNDGKAMTAFGIVMWQESCDFETAKELIKKWTGFDGGAGTGRGALSRGTGTRLASSKLPAWTRDKSARDRLVSSRRSARGNA